jgi:hypothetical protein
MSHAPAARRAARCEASRRGGQRDGLQHTRRGGRTIVCLAAALGLAMRPNVGVAQARELESYGPGAAEAKLML